MILCGIYVLRVVLITFTSFDVHSPHSQSHIINEGNIDNVWYDAETAALLRQISSIVQVGNTPRVLT